MTSSTRNLSQRYPQRRAFITGAASGLGAACAEILAREGWRLLLTDADEARLSLVAESFARDGAAVAAARCDVRDAAALRALVDEGVARLGGLDLALHCAGVAMAGPFHASTPEDWHWVFDVNLHGTANSCRAVVPHMARSANGAIVNVASAASFCTGEQMSAYNASKAAVVALSESLAQEYAPHGIHVMTAMPGFFRTRLIEGARGPQRTLEAAQRLIHESNLEAAQVAEAMLHALAQRRTHWVHPSRYVRLWWLKRLAPQAFQRWLPRLQSRRPRSPRTQVGQPRRS